MFSSRAKKSKSAQARDFVWPRMGLSRAWRYRLHRLARIRATPHALALGFAAGAFASFVPFIGLHFIAALVVAWMLRANLLASAVGTVVGNPLTLPFIWVASYNTGAALLGLGPRHSVDMPAGHASLWSDGPIAVLHRVWTSAEPILLPMAFGGAILGFITAAVSYVVVKEAVEKLQAAMQRRRQPPPRNLQEM